MSHSCGNLRDKRRTQYMRSNFAIKKNRKKVKTMPYWMLIQESKGSSAFDEQTVKNIAIEYRLQSIFPNPAHILDHLFHSSLHHIHFYCSVVLALLFCFFFSIWKAGLLIPLLQLSANLKYLVVQLPYVPPSLVVNSFCFSFSMTNIYGTN